MKTNYIAAAILLLAQLSACYAVRLTVTLFRANQSNQSNETCAVYYKEWGEIPSEKHPSKFYQAVVASASDPSGCEGVEEVRGRAAVVTEGNCSFYERALVAQTAGAGLLVVVANSSNLADLTELDSWFSPSNQTAAISLPVVFVEKDVGECLLAHINSSNSSDAVSVTAYDIPEVYFDPSGVLIIAIAIVTVLLASYLANTPFQFLRYGLLCREGEERSHPRSRSGSDETEEDSSPSALAALATLTFFVVAICTLLVLLYFFYYPMVYVVIGLYCLGTLAGLYHLLSPFVALIPGFTRCRLPENRIPVLQYRPDPRFFLTLVFCAGVVVWWALERHSSYAWILQDILGFAFITYLLSRILFLRPWVVAVFMLVLVFYDVFMVFITPLFTKDGESVMVKAAKGDNSEQLPIVFTVPKFLSTQLDDDCAKYTGSLGRSLLGYGDVGVPGLLVALCLQFDLQQRPHKRLHLYYLISGVAYIVGLIITFIALVLTKKAQPALLYLVPATLGAVTFTALIRKEFSLFFTGKPRESGADTERERSSSNASSSKGSLQVDETENGTELDPDDNTASSEKDALITDKQDQ